MGRIIMKYIIILLTSLFLVSNASADDKYSDISDVCKNYEKELIRQHNDLQNFLKYEKWALADVKREDIMENAKLYHYLDCREELGR